MPASHGPETPPPPRVVKPVLRATVALAAGTSGVAKVSGFHFWQLGMLFRLGSTASSMTEHALELSPALDGFEEEAL